MTAGVQIGHRKISIHGPRVGADDIVLQILSFVSEFQSTAPVWGPTPPQGQNAVAKRFQSTAPVWGPTRIPMR